MSIIKIKRERKLGYWYVEWDVIIDDISIGKIKNDEIVQFEISPGHHIIKVGFKKYISDPIEFDIGDNETIKFRGYYPSMFAHIINWTDKWCPESYPILVRVNAK